jgi:hypothetical protein
MAALIPQDTYRTPQLRTQPVSDTDNKGATGLDTVDHDPKKRKSIGMFNCRSIS